MVQIKLRNIALSDKQIIYDWISSPYLRNMIGTRGTPDLNSHEVWFNKKLNDLENIIKIIEFNSSPIGLIGTNSIDSLNFNAEIYLYVGNDSQKRKGVGQLALTEFIKILVRERQIHKVFARIFSFNQPSINFFNKCGFNLEGIQKDQIINPTNEQYSDLFWFGKIVGEKIL